MIRRWFAVHHYIILIVFYLNMLGSISLCRSSHWTRWIWGFLAVFQSIDFIFAIWTWILSILIRWSWRERRWRSSPTITIILTLKVLGLAGLNFFSLLENLWFLWIAIVMIVIEFLNGWFTIRCLSLIQLIFLW